VVRELMFRRPIELSVLSERRAFQPFGLEGELIMAELHVTLW